MKLVALDLETPQEIEEYGLQPWRAKTGEATIKSFAMWSDDGVFNGYRAVPSRDVLSRFLNVCSEHSYTICGWNLLFDISWLLAVGLQDEVNNCKWLDGMLLLKRIDGWRDKENGGLGYGLKEAVAERWPEHAGYGLGDDVTQVPKTKEEWTRLLEYNLKDTEFSCRLTREYWDRLTSAERRGAQIEAAGLVPVAQAYINGIAINYPALEELNKAVAESRDENLPILGSSLDVVASPKKLAALLFDDWGCDPVKLTPKGAPATDKESLLKLAIKHPDDPRFAALMALRKCNTRQSKFVDGVKKSLAYNGGTVTYPKPTIAGTYTGRMTYSSKQTGSKKKKGTDG